MIPKDLHIPGYDMENMLGKGGMAAVYQARQRSFGREVALKILIPVVEDLDDFSRRFLRESLIAAKLHHSHIVQVYDVGQHESYFYICMEYLSGGDLARKIRAGITLKESVRIIKQLADALDFAHRKNIIHRDIKPENILFREDGAAVLTDFGIAKELESQAEATLTGVIMGTPKYMSPEHIRGDAVDHRADLYALGIVFYRCLTNYVPFDGKDLVTTAYLQINEPVPTLPPEVACFQGIIDRLLEKAPEDRFQRGCDLVAALEAVDSAAYSADLTNLDVATASSAAPPTVTRTASGRHSVKAQPSADGAGTATGSGARVNVARFRADLFRKTGTDPNATILAAHMTSADARGNSALDDAWAVSSARRRSRSVAVLSGALLCGTLAFPANQYADAQVGGTWFESFAQVRDGVLDYLRAAGMEPAAVLDPFVGAPAAVRAPAAMREPATLGAPAVMEAPATVEEPLTTEESLVMGGSSGDLRDAGAEVMGSADPAAAVTMAAAAPAAGTDVEADFAATIAALLQEAEGHMAKGHFRQPARDNAYAKYRQVLELEPGNRAALAGIGQIASAYSTATERAIAQQQFDHARGLLAELRAVAPEHTGVGPLGKKLAAAIAKGKAQEQEAAAAQKAARIEELLLAAGVDEKAGRIRAPFGNNALEKYQQILELDPDHSQAIDKLVEYGR